MQILYWNTNETERKWNRLDINLKTVYLWILMFLKFLQTASLKQSVLKVDTSNYSWTGLIEYFSQNKLEKV